MGQAISTGPRSRRPSALRISQATFTSSSAWKVERLIRIVSPTPSASRVPRPTADFSDPDHFVPASVIPEVDRVLDLRGQQPVGGDRVGHAGRLDRHLEVLELQPLHQLDELDRRLRQRLDGIGALELVQVLGQRAGVDADPHRHPGRGRLLGDLRDLVGPADVAGVEANAVSAGVDRLQRQRVVEVNIGDHRNRRLRRRSSSAPRRPPRAARRREPGRSPPRRPRGSGCMVAATFAVSVLVIVCTAIGAPPRSARP